MGRVSNERKAKTYKCVKKIKKQKNRVFPHGIW